MEELLPEGLSKHQGVNPDGELEEVSPTERQPARNASEALAQLKELSAFNKENFKRNDGETEEEYRKRLRSYLKSVAGFAEAYESLVDDTEFLDEVGKELIKLYSRPEH